MNTKKIIRVAKVVIANGLVFLPAACLFAEDAGTGGTKILNPLGDTTLTSFLNAVLNAVITIGLPVLVLALMWCGFLYVKAQGKPEEITTANKAFFWTVIGAGVVLGAKVLSLVICNTLTGVGVAGLNCH